MGKDLKTILSDAFEAILAQKLNAFEPASKDVPHFAETIADFAAKSGLKNVPSLWLARDPKPNAAAVPVNNLLITSGLMRGFDVGYKDPVSPEMAAVIGHEMGHLKNQNMEMGVSLALHMGIPIAGMIAYHLIRKGREHSKDDGDTLKAIHEVVDEKVAKGEAEAETAPAAEKEERSAAQKALHGLGTAVKYCAVAGIGTVAGQLALRQFKLSREFAADRHGAELTSPETMIAALEKLHAYAGEVMETISKKDSAANQSVAKKITGAVQDMLKHTTMAHPSLEARTDALRGR